MVESFNEKVKNYGGVLGLVEEEILSYNFCLLKSFCRELKKRHNFVDQICLFENVIEDLIFYFGVGNEVDEIQNVNWHYVRTYDFTVDKIYFLMNGIYEIAKTKNIGDECKCLFVKMYKVFKFLDFKDVDNYFMLKKIK